MKIARTLDRGAELRQVSAEPPRRAPVPVDPALPRLPLLLAPDAMAPILHRSLGPYAPFPQVRVHHVRYVPGAKLVVHYDVGLDGRRYDAVAMIAARPYLARRADKPKNLALARLAGGRSPAPMPLHYEPELDVLIQWYPLDLELPALAEPPKRLVDELRAAGASLRAVGGDPTTLGYKPRRRAVLRVGEHVLKIYARQEDFVAAIAGLEACAGLRSMRTAALEGHLPARLVTVQTLLAGAHPARPAAVAREVGALLGELQTAGAAVEALKAPLVVQAPQAGVFTALPAQQLALAEAAATYVAAIQPPLRGRLDALLRRLEATVPSIDRFVLSHGDFTARQLLVTPAGLAVIDLDALRLAPAALDPATYAAYLVFGGPDDLDEASEVLDELLEGYGGRPLGLSWYLATSILRQAGYPFRYFDEHWPERVEGMVTAAEAALDR
jgi:phosphotransferase family enzyme